MKVVLQRFWSAKGYDDIRWYQHHTIDAKHAVLKFPNGFGVSIITRAHRQFEVAEIRILGGSRFELTDSGTGGVISYSTDKPGLMGIIAETMGKEKDASI